MKKLIVFLILLVLGLYFIGVLKIERWEACTQSIPPSCDSGLEKITLFGFTLYEKK